MHKNIVIDSSCLIVLDKIGELDILRNLFGEVIVTKQIASEFGKSLPEWIAVKEVHNTTYQKILEISLDKGEATIIAYALENPDCLLVIDELKARKFAEKLNIEVTGTFGLILTAKLKGSIYSVKSIIEKIKATNFRITPELEQKMLEKAGELD